MTNLFSIVCGIVGAPIASISYKTIVRIPKKYGIVGEVVKYEETLVKLNFDYASVVRKHIERVGGNPSTFTDEALPNGDTWEVFNKFIITPKGERKLRYYVMKGQHPKKTYFVGGRQATDAEVAIIEGWYASKGGSKKQEVSGLTTEEQVFPRAIYVDNILSLRVCGQTYTAPTKQVA